jgi:site-specific DNA recombinase
MKENLLEVQFITYLKSISINPGILNDVAHEDVIDDSKEKINTLQRELKEIEKRRKKWQYTWVNEMISDEDFFTRIEEENSKEKEINKQLSSLKPSGEKLKLKTFLEYF